MRFLESDASTSLSSLPSSPLFYLSFLGLVLPLPLLFVLTVIFTPSCPLLPRLPGSDRCVSSPSHLALLSFSSPSPFSSYSVTSLIPLSLCCCSRKIVIIFIPLSLPSLPHSPSTLSPCIPSLARALTHCPSSFPQEQAPAWQPQAPAAQVQLPTTKKKAVRGETREEKEERGRRRVD